MKLTLVVSKPNVKSNPYRKSTFSILMSTDSRSGDTIFESNVIVAAPAGEAKDIYAKEMRTATPWRRMCGSSGPTPDQRVKQSGRQPRLLGRARVSGDPSPPATPFVFVRSNFLNDYGRTR
jgi:hypothetical protein